MDGSRLLRRGVSAVCAIAVGLAGGVLPGEMARAATIREQQWHLDALKISQVHRVSTGKGVVVAVIDSGVQADHPDLAGRVLDGARPWPDSSQNKPDDQVAHVDRSGHGTAMTGLLAAKGGPAGALGIAPDVKILPIGVPLEVSGGGDLPAEAIRWATDHGAQVINMSLVQNRLRPSMQEAVKYALDHDVVIVAAGGNLDKAPEMRPPGSLPGVLAVSAVDERGAFWKGGTRGARMGLAAPGVNMVTLSKTGGYGTVGAGSSTAAPIVAGAAALIRSKYPHLKAPDVINRLVVTATDAGPAGRDDRYGFGRLNLLKALTAKVSPVTANPVGEPTVEPTEEPALASGDEEFDPLPWLLRAGGVALAGMLVVGLIVLLVVRLSRRRTPGA